MAKKDWKAYWKFMFTKAFRTGLQSGIGIFLSSSAGILDADLMQVILSSMAVSFLTVIQHALEQYKPAQTFDA
jgi:hypothetical protein|tara:strand:+ start:615 stop:833 length:219 start_codon:yes stop_codon:yes gene_type:complete